jgi:hypothetical protein
VARNAGYAADLLTWQADYERDVRTLTGQGEPVPMLYTQVSSWTFYHDETSPIPGAQFQAALARPDRLLLVGPKYFLPYAPDGIHLNNLGYLLLGAYHAKVYRRAVLEGRPWSPLRPVSVSRSGATLRVRFHVPVPPLVLDTHLVSDPGHYGFAFSDDSGDAPEITGVRLAGPAEVEITLAGVPTGGDRRLRYAMTGRPGAPAGPGSGPRGNLRDSDEARAPSGYALYNWCVHFEVEVP